MIMTDNLIKKISLISGIVAMIGGGGILGWFEIIEGKKEFTYKGTIQEKDTKKSIAGAEITFTGLTSKIPTHKTDSKGCFSITLSEEYSDVIIIITHKVNGAMKTGLNGLVAK